MVKLNQIVILPGTGIRWTKNILEVNTVLVCELKDPKTLTGAQGEEILDLCLSVQNFFDPSFLKGVIQGGIHSRVKERA